MGQTAVVLTEKMSSVGVIGLFSLFFGLSISTVVSLPVRCDVTCMMGSYCFRESCLPCQEGFFQDEQGHNNTHCKPWTYKSPSLHFVLKRQGSQTRDNEWTCPEDRELFRYAPGEYDCRKIVTIPNTTVSSKTTSEATEQTIESVPVEIVSSTNSSLSGQKIVTVPHTTVSSKTTSEATENRSMYPYSLNYVMGFSAIVVVVVVLVFIIKKVCKNNESLNTLKKYGKKKFAGPGKVPKDERKPLRDESGKLRGLRQVGEKKK